MREILFFLRYGEIHRAVNGHISSNVNRHCLNTFNVIERSPWQTVGQINCCSLRGSRTRDLTFDAVRIGKIHTPVFASGREAGGFESRHRIGWIVIRDAVAVVI